MTIDLNSFNKIFPSSFKKKLKESIVPFENKINHNELIRNLYSDINENNYYPSNPRQYILINKHNYVARIVPTFEVKDYYVYYFCLKMLEDHIAINRVEGTFGGWTLGNKIYLRESNDSYLLDDYAPSNSFNPFLWMKNWKDFQKRAYQFSKLGDFNYFIKFDIANFYCSINLDLLIRKIYLSIPLEKRFYGELLSHFLHNWNRKLEGYIKKTIGIPQDEIGDCSRILANFFLQEYDKKMFDLCEENDAKYLRYADDQIIYTKNKNTARRILFEASKYLFKNDLLLNSNKVIEFDNIETFNEYWAFELFDLLEDVENIEYINEAVKRYLDLKNKNCSFRDYSVLKRIISVNFNKLIPEYRFKILSELLNKEFLAKLEWWWFKRIYSIMNTKEEKEEFCNLLGSSGNIVEKAKK